MIKKIVLLAIFIYAVKVFALSPYVSNVFEFVPAPGQFVNILPEYAIGDDGDAILEKVKTNLVGKEKGTILSLGGWGGYIVVGFDHTISNVPDAYDFKFFGNAFDGNSEPGVVLVSADENENGLPDDTWYELAGSEFGKDATWSDYEVVYYRPSPEKEAIVGTVPDYILWKDNRDASGFIAKNSAHVQSYFPQWLDADSLVFRGTRLPNNGVMENGQFKLSTFDFGYADNLPNNTDGAKFKIDWAVDSFGNPANLSSINFIKIHTGVLQDNGWLGECSTELSAVMDLHTPTSLRNNSSSSAFIYASERQLFVDNVLDEPIQIFTTSGICVAQSQGENRSVFNLNVSGIYLVKIGNEVQKIVLRD